MNPIHKSTLFLKKFFPHVGHCRVLSRLPCAIQYVLISLSIIYISIYSSVYMNDPLFFSLGQEIETLFSKPTDLEGGRLIF